MKLRTSAMLAVALAATCAFLGSAQAGRTAMAWSSTQTRGLSLNGVGLGPLAAATPLRIAVALKLQNSAGLDQFIRSAADPASPSYGVELTPDQFASSYAPSSADAQAVASYLSSQGLSNVQTEPNRLFVTATGTAAQVSAAFNTTLLQYDVSGQTLYANATDAQVPSSLSGVALSVLGLNDAAKMSVPQDTVPNYLTSYTPQGFWKAYDVGSTPTGSKTAIAIFAEGDVTSVVTDLRTEEQADGLPKAAVTIVPVGPGSPDTAGADEWDMDTQFSAGMAGALSKLYIYDTTSLTDSDITLEFNKFATQNLAKAGSASFGECEYQAYLDGSMVAMDQVFAEAAAQGQTVFASSGDTGGFCPIVPDNGVPAGAPDVNYPASSQYVVSAGGTTLLTNADGTYNNEAAWLAGGGGPSLFEYEPWWQDAATPPTSGTCLNYVACPGKNLPDVSMDADPNSGANVYVGGQPTSIGGTSLSSPLTLGVWARLQSAHANKLGFAAPDLYAAFGSAGFHDVTLGNTGPYPATPGWDYATGLGTFDVATMNGLIKQVGGSALPPPAYKLAAPACTIVSDTAGDSSPAGSVGNVDSLDILAAGFAADKTNVTAKLLVKSLSSGPGGLPQVAGAGDVWYVTWSFGGTPYFLEAQFPGSTPDPSNPAVAVDYKYGHLTTSPTGGQLYQTDGAATGSLDLAAGVITISAPASVLGNPVKKSQLTSPGAQTFESIGTPATGGLLEPADSAGPGSSYKYGSSC